MAQLYKFEIPVLSGIFALESKNMKILFIILAFILLYLFAISPSFKRRKEASKFACTYYHRGYYDNLSFPENSISAFKRAVELNVGIELDVQLTKDKVPVVFHNFNCEELAGSNVFIKDLTLSELKQLKLLSTNEEIPTLKEVLRIVDGKVPLYIELKNFGFDYKELVDYTIAELVDYQGSFMLCAFNPFMLGYVRKAYPKYIRGLIIENYKRGYTFFDFVCSTQLFNFLARPDLISYHYKEVSKFRYNIYHKLGVPMIAWPVASVFEYNKYKDRFDDLVIEFFDIRQVK